MSDDTTLQEMLMHDLLVKQGFVPLLSARLHRQILEAGDPLCFVALVKRADPEAWIVWTYNADTHTRTSGSYFDVLPHMTEQEQWALEEEAYRHFFDRRRRG